MITESYILQVVREGLYLVLLVSAPPLAVSLVVGLLVNVMQASTQLQDHTISFVPKLVAVLAALALAGPWIGQQLVRFTSVLLQAVPLLR
jgi:flagellar biosynthetic protein FliQ